MNNRLRRVPQLIFLVFVVLVLVPISAAQTSDDSRDVIQPFNYEGVELLPGRLHDQYHQVKVFFLRSGTAIS